MFVKYKKGWRSLVYLDKEKSLIKKESNNRVLSTIEKEVNWLKRLNKVGIGPKLIEHNENSFICEFIEGLEIEQFLKQNNKKEIIKVLKNVLDQCYTLDKLKIDKREMKNPYKHIIISKKVVMIDFERAKYSDKPCNITGFSQYLISSKIYKILENVGIRFDRKELIKLVKNYKSTYNKKDFDKIKKLIIN